MNKARQLILKITKTIGILIAIPIVLILLLFVGVRTYQYLTKINYVKIIESSEFKEIDSLISHKSELRNIAVLPDSSYIILNGTIINRGKKTFGNEPTLGFYMQYYSEGNNYKYESLDSLLKSISSPFTVSELNGTINKMNSLEIEDILVTNEKFDKIIYRWAASASWGEEGIIKTKNKIGKSDLGERTIIKKISQDYYEFHR